MAYEYQSFATLGVNLNRQNYGALDISQVFTSQADLDYYLSKGTKTTGVSEYWYKDADNKIVPYPYEGQVIATVFNKVVKVYVLALDENNNFITQNVGDTSAVETAIADLEKYIGTIPNGEDGKPLAADIVAYINKKTEGIATDTALSELQGTVDEHSEAIGAPVNGETPASGLYKLIDDEAAARKSADDALDGRLDILEAKEDKDTTYSVASGEKILKLTGTEFSTVASLKYVAATETANAKIQLLGIDNAIVSEIDASDFIKDGMLESVTKSETDNTITFTWNTDAGKQSTTIDIDDLVEVYTAGNGIDISNFVISHKTPDSVASNVTKADRTYVAGITFDEFGHVKSVETATETDPDYTEDFNGKADKVDSAVAGNFAGLDANGNLTDSGKKAADFAAAEHTHTADEITDLADKDYQNSTQVGNAINAALENYTDSEATTKEISDAIAAHNTAKSHLTADDVNGQINTKLTAYQTTEIADGKYSTKSEVNTLTQTVGDNKTAIEEALAEEAQTRSDADVELQQAIDTKISEVTTTAGGGLKVTNKNQIDIDTDVVFILDGGTAADLIAAQSN